MRLIERCANILISIRDEIADAGYTVAEELRAPIEKLVKCIPVAVIPTYVFHLIRNTTGRSKKFAVSSPSWASLLFLNVI